jgi:hypothetical protein
MVRRMDMFALGRNVNHDERSRNFPAPTIQVIQTVKHRRYGDILDQGQVGSCTGNALAGAINTAPLRLPGRVMHEKDALRFYSLGTALDNYPGSYPPDDTGCDGLSVCKAGVQLGYLSSYTHAFGFDHLLGALMLSPVIIGINWYEGFYNPSSTGFVDFSGSVAGGHEIEVLGYDAKARFFTLANSWGKGWGLKGYFRMTDAVMTRLLSEQGDVTVPVS